MKIKYLILVLLTCMIAATLGCTSLGMNTIPMDKLKAKYDHKSNGIESQYSMAEIDSLLENFALWEQVENKKI